MKLLGLIGTVGMFLALLGCEGAVMVDNRPAGDAAQERRLQQSDQTPPNVIETQNIRIEDHTND